MANASDAGVEALRLLKATDPPSWLVPNPSLSETARAASQYLFSSLRPFTPKSPLDHLLVDGFDAEQIWQQIDLQSQPLLSTLRRRVKHLAKNPQEIPQLKVPAEEGANKAEAKNRGEWDEESDCFDEELDEADEDEDEEMVEKEEVKVGGEREVEEEDDDDDDDDEGEEEGGEEGSEDEDEGGGESEEEKGEGGGIEDKFLKIEELADYLQKEEENMENGEEGDEGDEEDTEDDDEVRVLFA